MALETLLESQRQAAGAMEIDFNDIEELQRPRIVMESRVQMGNQQVDVYRSHSGPESTDNTILIGKGGIRMAHYGSPEEAKAVVSELSVEMLSKLAIRGYANGNNESYIGAKGLIVIDANTINAAAKNHLAGGFHGRMQDAGLTGYKKDIPAGDVGTNGLADTYALSHYNLNPDDPYWQASITGKSVEFGGLEFRSAATGWGGFVSQRTIMNAKGHDRAETTIQGFGNVGAWHAHFASTDIEQRTPVMAVSDRDGTLVTNDPAGIEITREMVDQIGDNPTFVGNKIHALQAMVEKNQPGLATAIESRDKILYIPTDFFIPAAMGNVITAENVEHLGVRVGIGEDANGPTKPEAHRRLVEKGILVIPDIVANGAGVDCSIKERDANVANLVPPMEQIQKELTESSERVIGELLNTANVLRTKDMRVAAAGLSMAYLLNPSRPGILSELIAA